MECKEKRDGKRPYFSIAAIKNLQWLVCSTEQFMFRKRIQEKCELLILQNEERKAFIKVSYENNQYHIKVAGLKTDKIYEDESFNEIEQLLEELEYQIWSVGSGVLEGLQPLSPGW